MFDVARQLLVVDVEDGEVAGREVRAIEAAAPPQRAARVAAMGVDVLICGAISRPLEGMLTAAGVSVVPQTCGPVEEVLGAFVSGRLQDGAYLMPGCCGRRRRCRGGRRSGADRPGTHGDVQ